MAIAIYQETATSRKQWAESTSLSTLRKLASGEWVLFDASPADPPPAPDGLDAAAAALTNNPASLLAAAQRAASVSAVQDAIGAGTIPVATPQQAAGVAAGMALVFGG